MQTGNSIFQKPIKKKSIALTAILYLVLVLALSACSANNATGDTGNNSVSGNASKNSEQVVTSGDDLIIPISEISETPKFYPITVDGTRMEVFAVKASDGTIRTAFNTCQVCNGSPKAYFKQSGDTVQCQNCGNKFPMSRVGIESGGCNPVPILDDERTATDESITVLYSTLEANAYRFPANWKK
jgi:uncharacterized membrane protein